MEKTNSIKQTYVNKNRLKLKKYLIRLRKIISKNERKNLNIFTKI